MPSSCGTTTPRTKTSTSSYIKRTKTQARTELLKKSGENVEFESFETKTERSRICNGPLCLTPYITTVRGETRDFHRILL